MSKADNLVVRHAERRDLEALTALYNVFVETSPATFDIEPFTPADRESWLSKFTTDGPHQLFAAFVDDELAGYANSSAHRAKPAYQSSVETTIYVDPRMARHGVGRALYNRLFSALEGQDVHSAYAGVVVPNPASVAFHKSFGFTEIGTFHEVGRKFGRFHDVLWFEKRL